MPNGNMVYQWDPGYWGIYNAYMANPDGPFEQIGGGIVLIIA